MGVKEEVFFFYFLLEIFFLGGGGGECSLVIKMLQVYGHKLLMLSYNAKQFCPCYAFVVTSL